MALVKLNRFNGNMASAVYDIAVSVNDKGIAYVEDYNDHMMLTLLCGNRIRIENMDDFSADFTSGLVRYEKKNAVQNKDVLVCRENISAILPARAAVIISALAATRWA
ncbi:MAG: hypothetical protein CO187_05900 [Zetaproteobacteria bacterium CG_4_9_14_3_um_filter_53_7]|nr:MAG: hypothetical protein CO187_05900 [Zetaproteobacteria bacterium CG_4_9_14_3_um_filter_53_7]